MALVATKNGSRQEGFTLLELLVVIAIIGVLSSVVLASLNGARASARDSRRMADVDQIIKALSLHHHDTGDWIESGSECGHSGNGNGWFNYVGGAYPESMAQCLVSSGYAPAEIIDPSGDVSSSYGDDRHAYMKYTDSNETCVFAKLEKEPQYPTATDGTSCTSCDSRYGMNYYVCIDK